MVQIQQLIYFLKIAELQSMNKASEVLYVSQANLSYTMKILEIEVGHKLLERSNKGVFLTEYGKRFSEYARKIVEQVKLIENMKDENIEEVIRIASYPALCNSNLISTFVKRKSSEKYKITIDEYRLERVINNVHNSIAEIGVIQINMKQKSDVFRDLKRKELEYHHLQEGTWEIIVSKNHPIASKKEILMDELMEYPLIRARDDMYSNISALIKIGEHQFGDFSKVIYANDGATRLALLDKTDAFLTTATWSVSDYKRLGFAAVKLKDNIITTELGWIKRKKEELTDGGKEFIRILNEYML